MEASAVAEAGNNNNEQAFKNCGRAGRRGACIDADIMSDKLQDIIQKAENISLDEGESSQTNEGEKGT